MFETSVAGLGFTAFGTWQVWVSKRLRPCRFGFQSVCSLVGLGFKVFDPVLPSIPGYPGSLETRVQSLICTTAAAMQQARDNEISRKFGVNLDVCGVADDEEDRSVP